MSRYYSARLTGFTWLEELSFPFLLTFSWPQLGDNSIKLNIKNDNMSEHCDGQKILIRPKAAP